MALSMHRSVRKSQAWMPHTATRVPSSSASAAGSVVYANNYALAHGERWWIEPSAFRPERWLQEEQRLSAGGAGGKDACKYIPYSIGRRVCPGSRLADAELATVSDVLLRELRWKIGRAHV
jgi:cytochrome P450